MNKQYTLREVPDRSRRRREHRRCRYGRTALYAIDRHPQRGLVGAARIGKTEDPLPTLDIVKALLDRGANAERRRSRARFPARSGMDSGDTTLGAGTTPLMRAARAGDAAVIRLLLEKRRRPEADDERREHGPDVRRRRRLSRQEHARQRERRAGGREGHRSTPASTSARPTTAARPRCTAPRSAAPTPSCSSSSIGAPM